MKLVVGLGNPGGQYAETRHNIGWMVLDRLADRAGRSGRGRQRDASEVLELRWKGMDLILAKPQTYMNDSGLAVKKLMVRGHVPLVDMLVIADDFALQGSQRAHITTSVGIATLERSDDTPDTLLKRADRALYAAKHAGRNRVVSEAA